MLLKLTSIIFVGELLFLYALSTWYFTSWTMLIFLNKLLQRLSACDCLSEDSTERWKEARWTNLIAGSGLLAGLMGYSERKL